MDNKKKSNEEIFDLKLREHYEKQNLDISQLLLTIFWVINKGKKIHLSIISCNNYHHKNYLIRLIIDIYYLKQEQFFDIFR